MARDTTPLYVPHVVMWSTERAQVRIKTGPGQYDILSDEMTPKDARGHLRRFRRALYAEWKMIKEMRRMS